jgi:predicted nuclease with RNAse H fold
LTNAIEQAENIVVSYEMFPVNDIMLSDLREESRMSSAKTQDVFIIRSPLNLLASCIRRIENEATHKARVAGRIRNFIDNQFSH